MQRLKFSLSKRDACKLLVKYILFFVGFYVLSVANINGIVYPFSFGLLFALVWCNQNPFSLSFVYVLASFLSDLKLNTFLSALFTAVFLCAVYLVFYKLKKPIKPWLMPIFALFSQALNLYFKISGGAFVAFPILETLIGTAFMLALMVVFQAISVRGLYVKLTSTESICACIFVSAVFCGLSCLSIYFFSVAKFFGALVVLFSAYILNMPACLLLSTSIGVGAILPFGDTSLVCTFALYSLAVVALKSKQRIIPALALLAVEATLGFCFNIFANYSYLSLISPLVACIVFVLTPSKIIYGMHSFFSNGEDRLAMRNIVQRSRSQLSRRFAELSDVFNEMNKVFRATISGGLTKQQATSVLSNEIRDSVCKNCTNYAHCHRTNAEETEKAFALLITSAFERDKVAPFDLPPILTRTCDKANVILSSVNELSANYKKYAGAMNSIDASKVLIAEQLYGLSGILSSISEEVGEKISLDSNLENKIQNELAYNNIICSDVAVLGQSSKIISATAVVREDTLALKKIENIFSKICKMKMMISGEEKSPKTGWRVLSVVGAPKYDVLFGCASKCKTGSEQNGDSYSVTRLDNGKFLLALCDGMGSGMKAEKASSLAMGLVENFYRAGFDNDIILSSVNKLLSLGKEEVFSALDLCVIDLTSALCDVIKLGAPVGYVKKNADVEVIEAGALPLGILGSVTPCMSKLALCDDEIIVLCTDGITDSFFEKNDLQKLIEKSTSKTPQALCDEILSQALENCKGVAVDDMTVVCGRVFKRV